MGSKGLHPLIKSAAKGRLPEWAVAGATRRAHMSRVGALMSKWAEAMELPRKDVKRWRATGLLHDSLRDADPSDLAPLLSSRFEAYPPKALHGPAAAIRLQDEGIEDEDLLQAIRHHTLGAGGLQVLGLALYAADFLEPGRKGNRSWRDKLEARAVRDLRGVVEEIVSSRIDYLRSSGFPIHPDTQALRDSLSSGLLCPDDSQS